MNIELLGGRGEGLLRLGGLHGVFDDFGLRRVSNVGSELRGPVAEPEEPAQKSGQDQHDHGDVGDPGSGESDLGFHFFLFWGFDRLAQIGLLPDFRLGDSRRANQYDRQGMGLAVCRARPGAGSWPRCG